ncbi:MAG: (Fe-S)-binding protein [Desulfobacteraceae bacterium]|nr:(Fe-S)-binding protein [Desulfobacteraceae bacterium]
MHALAQEVRQLEDKLAVCTRCGMCQAQCPIFKQTRQESDVSRGKLALINGLLDQMFDQAQGVNDRLLRCLLCGSCAHACPSSVNTVHIFLKARAIITKYLGLSFAKKIIFKKILSDPALFHSLSGLVTPFQNLLFKPEKNLQGTSCARVVSPLFRHRHMVSLKADAFNRSFEDFDTIEPGPNVRVAFFVGCLIDKAYPHIAHDVVQVLNHYKAGIYIPSNQGCCGIPALASGDTATFAKLVEYHVNLFSRHKIDYLVTACATCSSTIIKLWPAFIKNMDKGLCKKMEALVEKTVDISWLLEKRFGVCQKPGDLKNEKVVTYHDPCHLRKTLDVFEEPRQVIKASGYTLKDMSDCDRCCGMGGSFNLAYYEMSAQIGEEKAKNIIDTGCSTVATSCPACMMQISDMLARQKANMHVKHPVELFAEKIKSESINKNYQLP